MPVAPRSDQSAEMALTARQECFGDAFLLAVAGAAGCAVSPRRPDDDSIDWTLSSKLPRRPKLDVQMKTTTVADDLRGEEIRYPLKRKNYDELILAEVFTPRILVLVTLPRDVREWLSLSPDQLILRRYSYWLSLSGLPESNNEHFVTVSVPRSNLLTVEALKGMMERINESGVL
jgi:hypothetical protein